MAKTQLPTNYKKHTSKNPVRQLLLNNFNTQLIRIIAPLNPKRILDAGRGEGFTLHLFEQHTIGKKLEGLDNSIEALRLAKMQFKKLQITQGSIYTLPYKDNTYNLVLATEVLEHLETPKKALSELIRVSNRYILLSVPNEPLFMLSRLLTGSNIFQFGNHPEHINHWSEKTFKKFLTNDIVTIKKILLPFPW